MHILRNMPNIAQYVRHCARLRNMHNILCILRNMPKMDKIAQYVQHAKFRYVGSVWGLRPFRLGSPELQFGLAQYAQYAQFA